MVKIFIASKGNLVMKFGVRHRPTMGTSGKVEKLLLPFWRTQTPQWCLRRKWIGRVEGFSPFLGGGVKSNALINFLFLTSPILFPILFTFCKKDGTLNDKPVSYLYFVGRWRIEISFLLNRHDQNVLILPCVFSPIKKLIDDIKDHKPIIENFAEVTQALILKVPPEERKSLEDEVNQVMGTWEDINGKVDARQKKEDQVKERAENYDEAKSKLAKIVERIETRMDEQRAFADEPEKVLKELGEIKVRVLDCKCLL